MKRIISLALLLTISIAIYSHPWKPNHYVIIDTDGGIDDIRAITMLLASPDVRVLAITVSPGALSTGNCYKKVKSLLNSYFHEGIPVGVNRNSSFNSPDFPVAANARWGDEAGLDAGDAPECLDVINEIIQYEKTKICFISLGSLSTASSALREIPEFKQQVKEIIWSSDGLNNTKGFNYNIDKQSSENLLKGIIPVRAVYGFTGENFYNEELIKEISDIRNIYAEMLSSFLASEPAKKHKYSFTGNDEMVVLYLHYPELFRNKKAGKNYESNPGSNQALRNSSLKILSGETVARNQLIRDFPTDPAFYFEDIEPYVTDIIRLHGMDEWISGVTGNELHRHLGVFAIIGVKMGIRAREYFNTGVDEFRAISYAGSTPPVSCMNDGIQVSTGATPGHGLLEVKNADPAMPVAEFTYMNRKIRLTLKPDISEKIISELKEINFVYGLDSNIYWELVRKNSIKYWLNLDRHDIFLIETLK